MLLVISSAKFRLQKYSYFLHLQKIIAVFFIKDFGTIIDTVVSTECRVRCKTNI